MKKSLLILAFFALIAQQIDVLSQAEIQIISDDNIDVVANRDSDPGEGEDLELIGKDLNRKRFTKKDGRFGFKVRLYGNIITATVINTTRADAFEVLEAYTGRYSDPKNHQKIAMRYSMPYFREHPADQNEAITFVLPPYMNTMEVVPTPIDEKVKINLVEAGYWAIQPFTWNYTKKRGIEMINRLIKDLVASGIIKSDKDVKKEDIVIAQYSEKLVPGALKKNEVWIKIASKDKKL